MTSTMADSEVRKNLYFEDLRLGERFTTASCTVTEQHIKAFAQEFDPQPFHLDDGAARSTLFGGLVASGWHTAALTMRLIIDAGPWFAGGTLGMGAEIKWRKPVRPGDILHIESEIIELAPLQSRVDRGRVVMLSETRNALGETVQTIASQLLVPRRPSR
ncbi:MAG TPA: MaoC family dehydratase [Steroidobacteraceae bacterium]|nr:MaoC family dehydratase [Steroidobacteraceae bacterium]